MGAPIGNQNGAKGAAYAGAVRRALARKHGSVENGLNAIADRLVDDALSDDPLLRQKARAEIADRLDGKPKQIVAGDDDSPLTLIQRIERRIVDPNAPG